MCGSNGRFIDVDFEKNMDVHLLKQLLDVAMWQHLPMD